MRCNNCGWDNAPAAMRCEKCNAPQKGSMVQENTPVSPAPSSGNLNETIKGARPSGPYIDAPNEPVKSGASVTDVSCPFCGYPNTSGTIKCINCKKPLVKDTADGEPRSRKAPDSENEDNTKPHGVLKTQTPWSKINDQKFTLKHLTPDNQVKQSLDYDGNEVILNRSNTIPNNSTITSNQQAMIFNKDGKWFIADKSNLHTTFIRPGEPVEIKKGDIILLGDSRFEFDI